MLIFFKFKKINLEPYTIFYISLDREENLQQNSVFRILKFLFVVFKIIFFYINTCGALILFFYSPFNANFKFKACHF